MDGCYLFVGACNLMQQGFRDGWCLTLGLVSVGVCSVMVLQAVVRGFAVDDHGGQRPGLTNLYPIGENPGTIRQVQRVAGNHLRYLPLPTTLGELNTPGGTSTAATD